MAVHDSDPRYAIGDLASLGGVSRRTVRYYVQEALIPPPAGLGRGNHYGPEHLDALLRVKAQQESGQTLDEIRRVATVGTPRRGAASSSRSGRAPTVRTGETTDRPALARSLWRRLAIAAGVELHVASSVALPSRAALRELDDWCLRHLVLPHHDVDERD